MTNRIITNRTSNGLVTKSKVIPTATRNANGSFPSAACQTCGGWTSYGGMSQFAKTNNGCKCNKVNKSNEQAFSPCCHAKVSDTLHPYCMACGTDVESYPVVSTNPNNGYAEVSISGKLVAIREPNKTIVVVGSLGTWTNREIALLVRAELTK